MTDTFKLTGNFKIESPPSIVPSDAIFNLSGPLYESFSVLKKFGQVVTLDADGAEVISFGDVAQAHLIILKSDQPVTIELTSALGVFQMLPGDLLVLKTLDVPITAMRLTRAAGIATTARLILAQKTP